MSLFGEPAIYVRKVMQIGLCLLAILIGFEADAIIHGVPEPLLATQIALGCLDADMPE